MQAFSCEICKISKNTFFFIEQLRGCFWGLTRVFKGVRDKKLCNCLKSVQYVPGLAEKSIYYHKNPEAATADVQ